MLNFRGICSSSTASNLQNFGVPGTAKTAVCDVVFDHIEDADKFHLEFSMFMGEDAIFGPYDMKRMREDGVLEHRVEGMLPEAHFARFGEFLDANMGLLRSTLSALHERRMRRGEQVVNMPLLSVYCDTNVHPGQFLRKHPHAWAVLDRLLFISEAKPLKEGEDVSRMIELFQSGRFNSPGRRISLEEIHQISRLVVEPPSLIKDRLIYLKLGPAFVEYRRRRQEMIRAGELSEDEIILPMITDRRFALGSQMAEVSAVLDSRLEVIPEDMLSIKYVLGTTAKEYDLWEEIVREKVEEIESERSRQLDHAQLVALSAIRGRIEALDLERDNEAVADDLKALSTELRTIIPENDAVEVEKGEVTRELEKVRETFREQVLESLGV